MTSPGTDPDALLVEVWPSPSEIRLGAEPAPYFAGLQSFYDSVAELRKTLDGEQVFARPWTDHSHMEGRRVGRFAPPETVEFFIAVVSSGVVGTLFKALDLWIKRENGRRTKVKFLGVEVEATQLGQKEFVELVERVVEFKRDEEEHYISRSRNVSSEEWMAGVKKRARAVLADYSPEDGQSSVVRRQKTHLAGLYQKTRDPKRD